MSGPADGECMSVLMIRTPGHLCLAATTLSTELVLKMLLSYVQK